MTARLPDLRPIEFRHVCAIARALIVQAPAMTDADWKEAVKETCRKQGWQIPDSDLLSRAFGAVERALQQTGFARGERPTRTPDVPRVDRCWNRDDYDALAVTLKTIAARQAAGADVRPIAQMLEVAEPEALDQFWSEAAVDAPGALKRFAEIAIVRPPEWDFGAVRAADPKRMGNITLSASRCFACRRDKKLQWHHVIQIQHGGSNHPRNRVAICAECHQRVHPWLPKPARGGWTTFADMGDAIASVMVSERNEVAS